MKKIKFIIARLTDMNYKKMHQTITKVKKVSNKFRIVIFFDMLYCAFKYGAGYTDYYAFGMYDLNKNQRETILTRTKNNNLVAKFNPKEYWHFFDNKNEFNEKFNCYLKRKWLYLENINGKEFEEWVGDLDKIIAKPNNDSGGHGIELLYKKDFKNTLDMFNYLKEKNLLLVEEVIKQHKALNKVYPNSVNTLRIITLKHNDKVHFITAFLRVGNNNSFVDNTSSGGMLTMIDLNRGVTLFPGCDSDMNVYYNHPTTKIKLEGIEIPYFNESKDLVEKLAYVVPEINYIAWDIAITDDGPVIVEGNPYPGYYYQFPIHTPNKIGIMPVFEKIINNK